MESRYVTLPCKSEKSEFPQSGNFSFHRVYLPIGTDNTEPGVARWVEQVCHLGGVFVLFIDHVIQTYVHSCIKEFTFCYLLYYLFFHQFKNMFLLWSILIIVNLIK